MAPLEKLFVCKVTIWCVCVCLQCCVFAVSFPVNDETELKDCTLSFTISMSILLQQIQIMGWLNELPNSITSEIR